MITIIFPAYNEEKRISKTLKAYSAYFRGKNYEFIVVNDGSTDRTPDVVRTFSKKDKRVRLLAFKINKGKGEAVFEGFKLARGKIIGFTDSDLAYKIEDVAGMIRSLENSKTKDGVIAFRYFSNRLSEVPEPFIKKVLGRGLNVLVKVVLGLDYTDTQAGAKFFKRKPIKSITKYSLVGKGFSFDIDLLYKAKRLGLNLQEYPVEINATHEGTTFKLSNVLLIFKDILKLRLQNPKRVITTGK